MAKRKTARSAQSKRAREVSASKNSTAVSTSKSPTEVPTTGVSVPKNPTGVSAMKTAGPSSATKGRVRKGPTIRKKSHRSLYLVLGTLVVVAAVITSFVLIQRWQISQASTTPGYGALEPADASVLKLVSGVSASTWESVGTGGVSQPFARLNAEPPLKGGNGLPEVLYIGGEYCPNCAAERWAMVNALSRFGTFQNVSQIHSYEESISTFSFEGSSYNSSYVDFVPREINGNTVDSAGNDVPLDKLTSEQQQIMTQDDPEGSIPFLDVGNQYKLVGASYPYTTLQDGSGNSLSWQDIASSLGDTSSPIAQSILGTANYLTAAICAVDGQAPASVCQVSAIEQIEQTLGATSSTTASGSIASALPDAVVLPDTQRRVSHLQRWKR